MHSLSLASILLLPAAVRYTLATSTACNNSPTLCSKAYNNVTNLGAHDSPFLRDSSTDFSTSGNQFYNSTVQLSAGVRLLSAQVQWTNGTGSSLHLCHTDCSLLDAGPVSTWLSEIKDWMDDNTNEVVTVLLVNGADATAAELAAEYESAGINTDLAYVPAGSTSETQTWPTLQTLIDDGTRLMNFVASLSDNTGAEYLMDEWTYIFENPYENTAPTDFSCVANRPSSVANQTSTAIADDLMPLMNHFLYDEQLFGIQVPNETYVTTTNAPSGSTGNLGSAATECTETYGKAPTFILVDFFNVGPAIETVDRLNGVTDAVGRTNVSTAVVTQTSAAAYGVAAPAPWLVASAVVASWCMLVAV